MKNKGIWVFRLSVGKGGNPKSATCPTDVDLLSLSEYKRNVLPLYEEPSEGVEVEEYEEEVYVEDDELEEIIEIDDDEEYDDDDAMKFSTLKEELFEYGRLRQGWGYEFEGMNLDLNQPQKNWIENYRKLNWRLRGEETNCENATGRWNILMRMTNMEIGDVIFVPRIPDKNKFTVATIEKKYFFQPMEEYFGHAHVLGVENVKEYSYENHFLPKEFNPYRNAVSQVGDHHKIYNTLEDFLEKHYL